MKMVKNIVLVKWLYITNCLEPREKQLFNNALGDFLRELLKCKIEGVGK